MFDTVRHPYSEWQDFERFHVDAEGRDAFIERVWRECELDAPDPQAGAMMAADRLRLMGILDDEHERHALADMAEAKCDEISRNRPHKGTPLERKMRFFDYLHDAIYHGYKDDFVRGLTYFSWPNWHLHGEALSAWHRDHPLWPRETF